MCCYKLVTIKFHVFGLETKVQQYIDKVITLIHNSSVQIINLDSKKSFFKAQQAVVLFFRWLDWDEHWNDQRNGRKCQNYSGWKNKIHK